MSRLGLSSLAAHAERAIGSLNLQVPLALRSRHKSKRALCCFDSHGAVRFIRVINELIETDVRFRSHTETGAVSKCHIRGAGLAGTNCFPRKNVTTDRKRACATGVNAFSLRPYSGGFSDG